MTNFTNKMTLIEFQIYSASKITHLQVHCKDFCVLDLFADIGEKVKSMIKLVKVENRQTTQGLASVFFPSKHLFFSCLFFRINLKPLASVFLISQPFSRITGSYFYHCDIIMQIQN